MLPLFFAILNHDGERTSRPRESAFPPPLPPSPRFSSCGQEHIVHHHPGTSCLLRQSGSQICWILGLRSCVAPLGLSRRGAFVHRYIHVYTPIVIRIKILFSCEIEDFVETHLFARAMCGTPIARVTVCVLVEDIGRRLPLELACTRVDRVMVIHLDTAKPVLTGS